MIPIEIDTKITYLLDKKSQNRGIGKIIRILRNKYVIIKSYPPIKGVSPYIMKIHQNNIIKIDL
jgi:hypothetical protein